MKDRSMGLKLKYGSLTFTFSTVIMGVIEGSEEGMKDHLMVIRNNVTPFQLLENVNSPFVYMLSLIGAYGMDWDSRP